MWPYSENCLKSLNRSLEQIGVVENTYIDNSHFWCHDDSIRCTGRSEDAAVVIDRCLTFRDEPILLAAHSWFILAHQPSNPSLPQHLFSPHRLALRAGRATLIRNLLRIVQRLQSLSMFETWPRIVVCSHNAWVKDDCEANIEAAIEARRTRHLHMCPLLSLPGGSYWFPTIRLARSHR